MQNLGIENLLKATHTSAQAHTNTEKRVIPHNPVEDMLDVWGFVWTAKFDSSKEIA